MLRQCRNVPLLSGDCSASGASGYGWRDWLLLSEHVDLLLTSSGGLGPDSKPIESSRTLSAETIGLEIGPRRDGILGGRALNFA